MAASQHLRAYRCSLEVGLHRGQVIKPHKPCTAKVRHICSHALTTSLCPCSLGPLRTGTCRSPFPRRAVGKLGSTVLAADSQPRPPLCASASPFEPKLPIAGQSDKTYGSKCNCSLVLEAVSTCATYSQKSRFLLSLQQKPSWRITSYPQAGSPIGLISPAQCRHWHQEFWGVQEGISCSAGRCL